MHKPAVIYIDTDSNYVQFGEMYESVEWLDESKKMDVTTFTLEVYCNNFTLNTKALNQFVAIDFHKLSNR